MSHLISRSITYKTKEIMVPLFKSLIRPVLEYANVVWSPSKKQDINALEQVQRRYTKHMIGMSNLTYTTGAGGSFVYIFPPRCHLNFSESS